MKVLNALGVDAYRGATQIGLIEPDEMNRHMSHLENLVKCYPHEARFIVDHIIYLPINKMVPFQELDKICDRLQIAINSCTKQLPLAESNLQWKAHSKL